ncbi:MAG: peptidoglycan-binding protein [bacterium]|nr:peptidoglycan-binding protein [bacterium]
MKRSIILSLALSLLTPIAVFAAIVTTDDGVTLALPNGVSYILGTNSKFTSFTINDSSIDFVFASDSVVYLTSGDRKIFTVSGVNNVGHSTVCNSNNSTIEIRPDADTPDGTTVNVSAASTGCEAVTSSSGGGGGGGGSPAPAPTPTPTLSATQTLIAQLQSQIATLTAQISALVAQRSGSSSLGTGCSFSRDLKLGSKGDDVTCLQNYLKIKGFYNYSGGSTGFFGTITRAAVSAWQVANGVSPAAGYFGSKSRAKHSSM